VECSEDTEGCSLEAGDCAQLTPGLSCGLDHIGWRPGAQWPSVRRLRATARWWTAAPGAQL